MADEESLRQVAQSPAPFSVWLGIVLLFALFGVIVLAIIGPAPRGDSYEQTRVKKRLDGLKTLREQDAQALTTYAWVDKSKGVARIPIERSMELMVAQLAQKRPAPAGPIATPSPPAAASAPASPAAPATSPAVPAATAAPSSSVTPSPTAPGSPLPIRGKTPP